MKVLIYLFTLLISLPAIAQVEEEVGFKYIKAKYLVETERYEEAIKAFSDIIDQEGDYEDALIYRADAKYKMAAYSGSKKDALSHIENHGITEEAIIVLGKADYRLKRYTQAINSLKVAAQMQTEDDEVYEIIGDIYEERGDENKACSYWDKAAQMGSTTAYMNIQKKCNHITRDEDVVVHESEKETTQEAPRSDKSKKGGIIKHTSKVGDKLDPPTREDKSDTKPGSVKKKSPYGDMPPDDNFENGIKIDDELEIVIYGQGLGRREVTTQPNVLIISDTDGTVAVDICVNNRGKVISSQLNTSESTLLKDHLVSLALRKAKEFYFERGKYEKQCGVMLFEIKSL